MKCCATIFVAALGIISAVAWATPQRGPEVRWRVIEVCSPSGVDWPEALHAMALERDAAIAERDAAIQERDRALRQAAMLRRHVGPRTAFIVEAMP